MANDVKQLSYEEKKKIADEYLSALTNGIASWDTLSDINSLHDAETIEDIHSLCDDRLGEDGFPDITEGMLD